MLENPTDSSSSTPNIATVKRYAPPNQRNRSVGRRKYGGEPEENNGHKDLCIKTNISFYAVNADEPTSADRLERANIYLNDGDRNQVAALRNVPMVMQIRHT